jgi:hypothetical protein
MTVPDPVVEPTDPVDSPVEPVAVADPVPEPTPTAGPEPEIERKTGVEATTPGAVDFRLALMSSVTLDLPSQYPSVVLRELDMPRRQLTFSIGMSDAVVLSHAFRRIPTPRPLTHELLSEVLQRFDIDVVAVRIVGRTGSILFAELDLRGRNGRSVHSCRPTDALTVALQHPVQVPILIDARLLEGSGDVAPPGPADR